MVVVHYMGLWRVRLNQIWILTKNIRQFYRQALIDRRIRQRLQSSPARRNESSVLELLRARVGLDSW
jgi:hypothetical protein